MKTPLDSTRIRDLFELPPDCLYLDHGGQPRIPLTVRAAEREWKQLKEAKPQVFQRKAATALEHGRRALATWLNANPEHILLIPNVRLGMAAIPRWLGLRPNEEILATDQEYPELIPVWKRTARMAEARYREVAPERILDSFMPETRLLCLSHVSYLTSQVLPVETICRKARTLGIKTIVDGAHAPVQITLNLEGIEADYYVGALHKWACLPYGAAFLWSREPISEPLRWLEKRLAEPNISLLLIKEALDFLHTIGLNALREHSRELIELALASLPAKVLGRAPMMVSLQTPSPFNTGPELQTSCFRYRNHHVLRLCFHAYNHPEELNHLVRLWKSRWR